MHAIAVMRHNFAFCTRSNTLILVETGLLSKILSNQIGKKFNNGRVSLQIFFFSKQCRKKCFLIIYERTSLKSLWRDHNIKWLLVHHIGSDEIPFPQFTSSDLLAPKYYCVDNIVIGYLSMYVLYIFANLNVLGKRFPRKGRRHWSVKNSPVMRLLRAKSSSKKKSRSS